MLNLPNAGYCYVGIQYILPYDIGTVGEVHVRYPQNIICPRRLFCLPGHHCAAKRRQSSGFETGGAGVLLAKRRSTPSSTPIFDSRPWCQPDCLLDDLGKRRRAFPRARFTFSMNTLYSRKIRRVFRVLYLTVFASPANRMPHSISVASSSWILKKAANNPIFHQKVQLFE